ncbi:MAG: M14 family metallopeptidase [Eubacterium sp.]|nr:M14 family metallopeptidase [Eubacterium sp.]MDD7209646.1 M14 family metallopeptidase [Lachnospiraceae bacterium]MDY5497836.1 M14 family metallopeptidase [Anaerobutyricum sp.]
MIETVMSVQMPVGLPIKVKKNRLEPDRVREDMPRVSILAGVHGDELQGQYICYEIIRRIKENRESLKGIVDVYPCLNPIAMEVRNRNTPGASIDMNAVFPGSRHGHTVEYMAAEILKDLEGSDFCIDIHSSDIFLQEIPQIRLPENAGKKVLDVAQKAGLALVWINGDASSVKEGSLAYSLKRNGIPNLVIESGIALKINYEYCHRIIDSIFSILRDLNLFQGNVVYKKKTFIARKNEVDYVHCDNSGIFVPKAEIGSFVRKGQIIGSIVRPILGAQIQEILSPCDGMIFSLREYPAVCEGELLARICHMERPGGKYEE